MTAMIVKCSIACAVFSILTVLKTYPLIFHSYTHISPNLRDTLLIAWILAWDFRSLTTVPGNLFNANIFYPAENTLAFSEHMIAILPIFAPPYVLTGNPIFGYNIAFLLSFVLSGMAMFLLVYYWTHNFWASLLSGIIFAFSPIRLGQIGHFQLLNFYWAPLALLFLSKFLQGKHWRDLLGFAAFYWLQILSSVYLGWFITIAVVIFVLYYAVFVDRKILEVSMISRYTTFVVLSFLILVPFHVPYIQVHQRWGFSRPLDECIFYSADLFSYLSASPQLNNFYGFLLQIFQSNSAGWEKWRFPGLTVIILAFIGSFTRSEDPPTKTRIWIKPIFGLIAISSFVISLGPFLLVLDWNSHIPLPYLLLFHFVPGFRAMRVPARFALMVMLAVSVLAALGFLRTCHYLNSRRKLNRPASQAILFLICVGVFALELGFKPLSLAEIATDDEIPEVYRWLARERPGPIVELPYGTQEDNYRYTYFSTYHWLPTVNGISGFIPPTHYYIGKELETIPSREAVAFLSTIGVKALVVHTARLDPYQTFRLREINLVEVGLKKAAQFGSDVVYMIPDVEVTQRLDVDFAVPDLLPAGALVKLGILARGIEHRAWMHPRPLGRTGVIVEWEDQQSERRFSQKILLEFPLAIRAMETTPIGVSVRTPPSPGLYILRLSIPAFDAMTISRVVEVKMGSFPTSLNSPQRLAAAYSLEGLRHRSISPAVPLSISLKVLNTGHSLWLANAAGDKGAVRLGWRWLRGGQEVPFLSGRELLSYDVSPGQLYDFHVRIATPMEPGEYTLELELVSELVTWFSRQGMDPLRLGIHVVNP